MRVQRLEKRLRHLLFGKEAVCELRMFPRCAHEATLVLDLGSYDCLFRSVDLAHMAHQLGESSCIGSAGLVAEGAEGPIGGMVALKHDLPRATRRLRPPEALQVALDPLRSE